MDKRRLGYVFVSIGAVLLCAALLLFLHNRMEDERAGQAAGEALSALQEVIENQSSETAPLPEIPEETEAATEPGETIPDELPIVNVDGNDYIGYLSFPGYEIELPVMADWSMEKLQIAPCLQSGSPLTDDAVIAAHNFKKHFLVLHNIQVREKVIFTDMNGNTIEYTVAEVKIIDPTSVYEVIHSDYDLILYTCTSGGQARVTVRCNRTEKG